MYFVCAHSFNEFQQLLVCVQLEHAEPNYFSETLTRPSIHIDSNPITVPELARDEGP
jgi:hypothetical protein